MAQTKQANIKELIPDSKNFNRHSEYGMSLLEKSVGKFGMGRSILLDKNNKIIAGNGITETAGQLGIEDVEIVESDGKKLIAVKRTDIDLDTPEGREMALADNATNKANLAWDFETIEAVCPELEIEPSEWGVKEWEAERLDLSTEGREGDEDYDSFKEKFEQKLTTDDCYTPPKIYDAVVDWVDKNITPLKGRKILRPFFPGGDYEHYEYPEGSIVIDNPPFSISAQILDFYLEREIPFFLFNNALTSLGTGARREGITCILIGEMIEFENGAKISIGFFTNLCPDVRVWLAADLSKKVTEIQTKPQDLALNKWDIHIQSAGLLGKIAKRVTLKIMADECEFISKLSDGTAIYGGGVVLSDRAAKRAEEKRLQAEEERRRAEEERRRAEEERRKAEEERAVNRLIGDKEREIIERLNRKNNGTI